MEALKAKNIKQTELVADLREAILQVAQHFQCIDPKSCNIVSKMNFLLLLTEGFLLQTGRTKLRGPRNFLSACLLLTSALYQCVLFLYPSSPPGTDPRLYHGEPPTGPRKLCGMFPESAPTGQGTPGFRAPR